MLWANEADYDAQADMEKVGVCKMGIEQDSLKQHMWITLKKAG
jgi:hypothetical protein